MVERRLPEPRRRRPGLALRAAWRARARRGPARRLARMSSARPAGARPRARRAQRRSGSRPSEDRRRSSASPSFGRVQGSTCSCLAGSPGMASIKAAPIWPRSPKAPIGAATERSSRSPQALRWAGALRPTILTSSSVARAGGRRAAARTIASLSDAAYWPSARQLREKLVDALRISQPDLQIEHPAGFGVVVPRHGVARPGAQHEPRKLIGLAPQRRLGSMRRSSPSAPSDFRDAAASRRGRPD